MSKKDRTHSVLFRKIVRISIFLNVIMICVSFFAVEAYLLLIAGMIAGNAAAYIKLYLTFYGMYYATAAEDVPSKSRISVGIANIFSYILLAGILVICAMIDQMMLFGSIAGVFLVYLAVLIHIIIGAFKKIRGDMK